MTKPFRLLLAAFLCVVPLTPGLAAQAGTHPAMVVAAHPLAAEAGRDVLAKGGTAVDAAVAVQTVLGLVEPQSSGVGGGAFMLYYEAATGKTYAFDGRETAPAAVTENLFLGPDGRRLPFLKAAIGGRAVGVPGVVAMLEMAQKAHGKLPWKTLFDPAISLSEKGFAITPRFAESVASSANILKTIPGTAAYFLQPDGTAFPAGHIVKNPAYAATLKAIADGGAAAFYHGRIAQDLVDTVTKASNPGTLTLDDMAKYQAKERDALCRHYRMDMVCTVPPPTSGGLTTLQMLGLLERFDLRGLAPDGLELVHLESEASRLAYADRAAYIGDPAFIDVPVKGMLDDAYLASRSKLIDPKHAMATVEAGQPAGSKPMPASVAPEGPHTSHFSIVDSYGNVLAMTTSVQIAYGSGLMSDGFIVNNELTDFETVPREDGKPVANRPEGSKRPRSSMDPVIVFDHAGRPILAIGSPGGASIIGFVTQTLVACLDSGLSVQQAVALPHYLAQRGTVTLEAGTDIVALKDQLEALGHKVSIRPMDSGLHGIALHYDGGKVTMDSGIDPRREGEAARFPE